MRVIAIGSLENARVGVHGNAAIAGGGASNEVAGSGAVTFAASPRVTIAGEFLFRRLSDLREIAAVTAPHPTIVGVDTLRLVPGTVVPTLANAVTGVKWNVAATLVISGQVVWRVGNAGLTAPFTPLLSVDYLF